MSITTTFAQLEQNASLRKAFKLNIDGVTYDISKELFGRDITIKFPTGSSLFDIDSKIDVTQKAIPGGVASLDNTGRVPAAQLPSYVDDVLEFATLSVFPVPGEKGKSYVDISTNKLYRWSGTTYIYITSGAVDSVNGQTGLVVIDDATTSSSGLMSASDKLKLDNSDPYHKTQTITSNNSHRIDINTIPRFADNSAMSRIINVKVLDNDPTSNTFNCWLNSEAVITVAVTNDSRYIDLYNSYDQDVQVYITII